MKNTTPEEVRQLAASVARAYRRQVFWADVEELAAEATVAILKADTTFDPDVGVPFAGYAWRAAVLSLKAYLWRQSPVTASWGAMMRGDLRGLHRAEVPLDKADDTPTPDVSFAQAEWREQVVRRLAALDASGGLALDVLLGQRKSQEVASARGVDVREVYRATMKMRSRISKDYALWELWKEQQDE